VLKAIVHEKISQLHMSMCELQVEESRDVMVDAICGNGNDTEMLASIVGGTGTLHAVDIQEEALRMTSTKFASFLRLGPHFRVCKCTAETMQNWPILYNPPHLAGCV
jgi:ubiquinone/menaquinone biosynthesis C-methylase UbiE